MATTLGATLSTAILGTQAAADSDVGAQTISTVDVLGNTVALGASTQTAFNNLVADINDLKAKLRAAGLLAT